MIVQQAYRLDNIQEYYFVKKIQQLHSLKKQGVDVINLGIGSPDMPPQNEVCTIISENTMRKDVHGYQSYRGIDMLRESIASWSRRIYNVEVCPQKEILPLIGSKEGIMHISMAFVNKGDGVLLPNPGYPTYRSVSEIVEAKIFEYSVSEDFEHSIDLEQVEHIVRHNSIKIMWINFPHMPTGIQVNLKTIGKLINLSKKYKFLIVHDNPYSTILTDDFFSIFQLNEAWNTCVELNSLSKSHNMAGWRIGWAIGTKEYIDTILKVKSNMDSGMFLPLQLAAAKALTLDKEWIQSLNNEYRKRRDVAWSIMDSLNCTYNKDTSGLFVWGKINDSSIDGERYSELILNKTNIFITPGFIFGSNGNNYIRISLCADTHILKEALKRIRSNFDIKKTVV
jgi:LL-diaminopimelate aminotransferase